MSICAAHAECTTPACPWRAAAAHSLEEDRLVGYRSVRQSETMRWGAIEVPSTSSPWQRAQFQVVVLPPLVCLDVHRIERCRVVGIAKRRLGRCRLRCAGGRVGGRGFGELALVVSGTLAAGVSGALAALVSGVFTGAPAVES